MNNIYFLRGKMEKETAELLLSLKSTRSFEDIVKTALSNYGIFDNYDKGAHKTNVEDVNGLEAFCKQMYIDWGNSLFYNYDNLNASQKKVANFLRKNPEFYPKNMEKMSGTPFYDFIMKGYDKNFSKSGTRFAKLQDGRTILSDREEGFRADSFLHVYGQNPTQDIQGRLYLNLMANNIPKFCHEFYTKCREANIPFYFKFSLHDFRNDTFLAYCSYQDLPKYVEIIESIKAEKPELLKGTEVTKPNLGVFNGYIGYGDEPSEKNESFTSIRNLAVKDVVTSLRNGTKNKYVSNKDNSLNAKGNVIEKLKYLYISIVKSILDSNKIKFDDKQVEMFLSRKFDNDFSNLVLRNIPMKNVIINDYEISIGDIDFLYYYRVYFTTNSEINNTILRADLSKHMFFDDSYSPTATTLFDSIHSHLIESIKDSVKQAKSNSMDNQVKTGKRILEIMDKPKSQLDETSSAVLMLAAANFLKNGIPCINFSDENYNFCEISYDVYKDILGKEKVEKILRSACDDKNISFENVALNKSTFNELNLVTEDSQSKELAM